MIDTGSQCMIEQAQAITAMAERIGEDFDRAVHLMFSPRGRVIVMGMGKSGIIGKKIAATLASTGTTSFFVHPAEAYHGDLGMIRPIDVALLISYSGETEEVIRIVPWLKRQKIPYVAMTGNPNSTLAKQATVHLDVSVAREACPHNLAPTSSTTTTLVMGDALAVSLMRLRNFQPQDFAFFHPGGSLGRRLLTRVDDVMHKELPLSAPGDQVRDVVSHIGRGRLGLTLVVEDGRLAGVITDGDLRRALLDQASPLEMVAADIMTRTPVTVPVGTMFCEAEAMMRERKINSLIVLDGQAPVGVVQIYDVD